jgi:hypothetical protein
MLYLNDIDEKIINKEYLIDLLELLDCEDHISLYGYYTRYIFYSIKYYKITLSVIPNLKKIFGILYKNNWLPQYFMKLTDIVEILDKSNFEKLMNYIYNYMNQLHEKSNDEIIRGRSTYKLLIKVMIIDNIKKI